MSAPAPQDAPSANWPTGLVFAILALPVFLAISNQSIVSVALPAIGEDLHNLTLLPFLMSGYMLALTISGPIYGVLGDALGRAKMLLAALGLHILGSAICAYAPDIYTLATGRVIQGLGGGGLMSLSQALIGQIVARKDQGRAQGFIATVNLASATASPLVGGLIVLSSGWRTIFVWAMILALLSVASLMWKPLPRTPRRPISFDFVGLLWMTAFVFALSASLEPTLPQEWRLPLLGVTALSLVLLVRSQLRSPNPMFPPALLKIRAIMAADVMTGSHGGVLVGFLTLVPLYQSIVLGDSIAEITWVLLAMTMGAGFSGFIIGGIITRTGRLAIFPRVTLPLGVIAILLLPELAPHLPRWVLIGIYGLIGATFGSVMPVALTAIMLLSPKDYVGRAAGNITFFRSIGALFGTALASLVLFSLAPVTSGPSQGMASPETLEAWNFAFRGAFGTLILLMGVSFALSFWIPKRVDDTSP